MQSFNMPLHDFSCIRLTVRNGPIVEVFQFYQCRNPKIQFFAQLPRTLPLSL